jgi:hypothetical protein
MNFITILCFILRERDWEGQSLCSYWLNPEIKWEFYWIFMAIYAETYTYLLKTELLLSWINSVVLKTGNFSVIFLANSLEILTDGLRGILNGICIFFTELMDDGDIECGWFIHIVYFSIKVICISYRCKIFVP